MKIKNIFKNTNFPIEAQKQKENILQAWQKKYFNCTDQKETFDSLLRLCSNITYYSSFDVTQRFNKFIKENNINLFQGNKYVLIPYQTQEFSDENRLHHNESSVSLYFYIYGYIGFSKNSDPHLYDNTLSFLEKIKKSLDKLTQTRCITQLNNQEQYFASLQNLIVIDDFLGSGSSIKSVFNAKNASLFNFLGKHNIDIKIVCLSATKEGEDSVNEAISEYEFINLYVLDHSCSYQESSFLSDNEKKLLKIFFNAWNGKYLKSVPQYNKDLTICSYVNVPNNDIPMLWKNDCNHQPLLNRDFSQSTIDKEARKRLKSRLLEIDK